MEIVALIAVRMGSSRLPGKALLHIAGEPMLARMIERVRAARLLSRIVLATTDRPEDDAIAALAVDVGVECYRGSADDVLGRLHGAAAAARADVVVELLGDNPLVHGELIDDTISFYLAHDYDYVATVTREHRHAEPALAKFPIGVRVEVLSRAALDRCESLARDAASREHATSFIHDNPALFRLGYFAATGRWAAANRPELTFAVNYREHLEMIRTIFERCHGAERLFSLQEAIRVLDASPDLALLMATR